MIFYRNDNPIAFFNVSDETADKFMTAIFKRRNIKIMLRNPAFTLNFAENDV